MPGTLFTLFTLVPGTLCGLVFSLVPGTLFTLVPGTLFTLVPGTFGLIVTQKASVYRNDVTRIQEAKAEGMTARIFTLLWTMSNLGAVAGTAGDAVAPAQRRLLPFG